MNKKKFTVIVIIAIILILATVFCVLYCTGTLSGLVDAKRNFRMKM